jgi:hypothetical protein
LRIGLPGTNGQGGAVWNFPAARHGRLEMRLRCREGFGGATVHLTGRMFEPCDPTVAQHAVFSLPVSSDGHISRSETVPLDEWFDLAFDWDLDQRTCVVSVNGEQRVWLKPAYTPSAGVCYVHLQRRGEADASMDLRYTNATREGDGAA